MTGDTISRAELPDKQDIQIMKSPLSIRGDHHQVTHNREAFTNNRNVAWSQICTVNMAKNPHIHIIKRAIKPIFRTRLLGTGTPGSWTIRRARSPKRKAHP